MRVYDEIKEMLCDELEDVVKKKELTQSSLELIDTAIDVIKDIHTIKAMEQEYPDDHGYSQGYYGRMPVYMYDDPGMSYARGGSANMQRTSRGRYYNDGYSGDTKEELEKLMNTAKTDRERETIRHALENIR